MVSWQLITSTIFYINRKTEKNAHLFQKCLSYLITINDETVLLRTGVNFTLTDFLSPGFNIRLKMEWRVRPFVSPTVVCSGWTLRGWRKRSNTLKSRTFLQVCDRNGIILARKLVLSLKNDTTQRHTLFFWPETLRAQEFPYLLVSCLC